MTADVLVFAEVLYVDFGKTRTHLDRFEFELGCLGGVMVSKTGFEPQDEIIEVIERGDGDSDLLVLREIGLGVECYGVLSVSDLLGVLIPPFFCVSAFEIRQRHRYLFLIGKAFAMEIKEEGLEEGFAFLNVAIVVVRGCCCLLGR